MRRSRGRDRQGPASPEGPRPASGARQTGVRQRASGALQTADAARQPSGGRAAGGGGGAGRVSRAEVGGGSRPPFWSAWGWRFIGVAILVVILWRVGLRDLARELLQLRPLTVVAAVLLATLLLTARAVRWWLLCRGLEIDLSLREGLRIYLVGTFVASATPGRVGDIVKAYYVRTHRSSGGLAAGIASVVYDRLLDLGQIAALALGAIVVLPWVAPAWGPSLSIAALVAFVLGTAWGPTRRKLLAAPLGWALRRLPGGDGIAPQPLPARHLLGGQVFTFLALACFVGETVVLARGLGVDRASWWELAVLAALGTIVGLAPITVFGIGTRDALFVAAAPLLAAARETMLGLSLLMLALYAYHALLGWAAWVMSPPAARRPPTP